jgi:hypothetical protein
VSPLTTPISLLFAPKLTRSPNREAARAAVGKIAALGTAIFAPACLASEHDLRFPRDLSGFAPDVDDS